MITNRMDVSQTGKIWILLLGFCIALYFFWGLTNSLVGGSLKYAISLGAGFVAIFILAKITSNWRHGVYYFFAWLLFEDLVRKYMGNNMTIYFAKDALLAVTYGSFLVSRMKEKINPFRPPFRYALMSFVILGFVQVLNPFSPSIFYGLLGLKLYFYYIPLMFVGYSLFQSERDIPKFFSFNMALAGVIAVIGIIQSIVGLDFLNPRNEGQEIDELSHLTRYTHDGQALVRAPSVFVSDGRFGAYMFVVFIIGIGGAGYLLLRSRPEGRIIVFPCMALVTVGAIMTGSRGALVVVVTTSILMASAFLWGAPPGKVATYRLVKAIRRSFVLIVMAMVLAVVIFPDAVVPRFAFYKETLMPNSEYSEVNNRGWDYPVGEFNKAAADPDWLTGHGIGTVSLGIAYVRRIMGAPEAVTGVENGYGAILLEFGILGPILWIFWAGSLVGTSLKVVLKLKGTWAFPIGVSILWFVSLILFPLTWGSLVLYQNFVTNAYLWLFVGILFRLPELVKKEAEENQVATV